MEDFYKKEDGKRVFTHGSKTQEKMSQFWELLDQLDPLFEETPSAKQRDALIEIFNQAGKVAGELGEAFQGYADGWKKRSWQFARMAQEPTTEE